MGKIIVGKTPGFRVSDLAIWGGIDLFIIPLCTIGFFKALADEAYLFVGITGLTVLAILGITFGYFYSSYKAATKQSM